MINLTNSEHWLIEKASQTPNQIAILSDTEKLTFEQLAKSSVSAAKYLLEAGIKDGDNVGILSQHNYKFWILVNALWLIGAVPVPLNSRSTSEDIQWQLQKVEASTLINLNNERNKYALISTITFDDYYFTRISQSELGFLHSLFSYSLCGHSLILFTSGSTGKPKAVVHTFMSLYESIKSTDAHFNLSRQDMWLASLPLYHIGGFMILARCLAAGSTVVFPKSLKHNDIVECSYNYNPTHISFVSTTLKRILETGERPNKNLKYIFLGGGPLSKEICERAIQNGFPIVKVYGSTETSSMVCALKPEEFTYKAQSVGKPLTEQISIRESNGELLISSPTLFKEYCNDDKAAKQKNQNGFYHTGDFGRIDNDGYVYIEARREDIVITGGENVSANEVEIDLTSIPKVSDSFVFGLTDETWGEILCAAIVSQNLTEEEIISALRIKLASYKIPKKFFFVSEIPRNEIGKVKRKELMQILNLNAV